MKRRYFILASLFVFFAGSLFAQSRFNQYEKVVEASYRNSASVNVSKLPAATYYYSIQWHGGMYRGALIIGQ